LPPQSCRHTPRPLVWLGLFGVFRGIPELLVIYLFYFGGSGLVSAIGQLFGADGFIEVPPFLIGSLAIGLFPPRIRLKFTARRAWR
jgi:ABC-type arginine transport system permease subunit